MANAFNQSAQIFFEKVIEGFDSNSQAARNVTMFSPNMTDMQRSALTVWRPVPMIAEVTTGRDVSADYKDIKRLAVPVSLAETDILNHAFQLTSVELNDEKQREDAAKAAAQALSSKIDTLVADEVRLRGSLVCTETGSFTDYDHLAKGETAFAERGVPLESDRVLYLTPAMARKMANELGSRATGNNRDLSAYERSVLPMVGGFETLRGRITSQLVGTADPVTTVGGANQRKTPVTFDGTNAATADNRVMDFVASDALLLDGDAFTIADVYAVDMISKASTGRLQTFRVISGGGTVNLVISPAIIPADQAATEFKKYANVNTTPANLAAITRLNAVTVAPSLFWLKKGVELIHGKLNVDDLRDAGCAVEKATTDSGLEIVFIRQGAIDTLNTKYRLSVWANPAVLDPQFAGIYLPNQTVAFG